MPSIYAHPGVPRRYLANLLFELVRLVALMLVVVEALYLSDKTVTQLLFDTLRSHLGLGFLLETLLYAMPEILSVAFPLTVVIAVYIVLLRRRESGDFVILSSAGLSPRVLVALCLVLGVLAMAGSAALQGFVAPYSAYKLQQRLQEGRQEVLRSGRLIEGKFLTLDGSTFYLSRRDGKAGQTTRIFIDLAAGQFAEEIITAEQMRLQLDPRELTYRLELKMPTLTGFTRADGQRRVESHSFATNYLLYSPVPFAPPKLRARGETLTTMTLPELLGAWRKGEVRAGKAALERLITIALAFLAPLLAGLALALSRDRLPFSALLGVVLAVLGIGLGSKPAAGMIGALGLPGGLALLGLMTMALTLALATAVERLFSGSVRPRRVDL